MYTGLNKFGNTFNKFVRNKTDLFCPILPIKTVTALFHEFGIHTVLYLPETKFQLSGNFCILNLLCFRFSIICTQSRSAYGNRRCAGLLVRLPLVESYLVYHRIETVIVWTERVQDSPHHIKCLVVVKSFLRRNIGWHYNRDDDISILLFIGLPFVKCTHHTANRLHHIHLRITGRKKQYGIERRHIHTLGQTTHVGYNTAFTFIVRLFRQPLQDSITLLRVHRTIYMPCRYWNGMQKAFWIKIFFIFPGYSWKHRSYIFWRSGFCFVAYGWTERHGTAHHAWVGIPCAMVVAMYHFWQSVYYPYELGCVVKIQFGGRIGDVLFYVGRYIIFANSKDKHLVIRQ